MQLAELVHCAGEQELCYRPRPWRSSGCVYPAGCFKWQWWASRPPTSLHQPSQ